MYIPTRVRHIGTEYLAIILGKMRQELEGKVKIMFNARAEEIIGKRRQGQGRQALRR